MSAPLVEVLQVMAGYGVTPRDLAGDIWWEKLSQAQKEAQHGAWTTGYAEIKGPMACWDCGEVQEADLERFHCFICGGISGMTGTHFSTKGGPTLEARAAVLGV